MSYGIEEFYDGKWQSFDIAATSMDAASTLCDLDANRKALPRRVINHVGIPILYGRHPMPVTAPAPDPDIKPWWGVYRDDVPHITDWYPDEQTAIEGARETAKDHGAQYVVAKVTPVLVVGFVERRVGGGARGE